MKHHQIRYSLLLQHTSKLIEFNQFSYTNCAMNKVSKSVYFRWFTLEDEQQCILIPIYTCRRIMTIQKKSYFLKRVLEFP